MRRFLFVIGGGFLLLIIWHLVRVLTVAGAFASLEGPVRVDECLKIEVAPGAEDITIDRETGIALVSASDRRGLAEGAAEQGGIYAVDINNGDAVRLVSTDAPADFQPHGISLWRGENGAKRLFVVSHPVSGGHTIEIFTNR